MLDVAFIRENPEKVRLALEKRAVRVDLNEFLALDEEFRRNRTEVQRLRTERNRISELIAQARRNGQDLTALHAEARTIADRLDQLETTAAQLQLACKDFLDPLPNLPDDDVLPGGKENNQVIRTARKKPEFEFPLADHVQLAENLGLIDYQRGVKLGGSGSWIYRGDGAMLEWALLNYFVEAHRRDGYEFVLPPHILGYEAGYVAGQFPKFAEDVFIVEQGPEGPKKFLLPTSETALVNFHRDETLREAELPKKYFAYSPCYRKEVGGYRPTERGTLRGHQFQKVEMFQFVRPGDSEAALEELLDRAQRLVTDLGLHYQVTNLAAEDLSGAMAKTFDIEVWLPSINAYTEISSVSNSRDYQARRGNIRYRPEQGKAGFVHTLNASGLATSRLLPAILEQNQREDGSVIVPEVLRKWGLPEMLTPLK